jgi:tetratricopeptide (TPR) repeat protein
MMNDLPTAIQLRTEGQYAEAQAILDELLALTPDDAQVNYHYAWWCDVQGLERAAVPYYVTAIAQPDGLSEDERRGALLGLGSTYRTLGEYENAITILERGIAEFPTAYEFTVFLAMAFYNVGRHAEAMALLLRTVTETTADAGIRRFARAITFYSNQLDQVWT